ncbi:MAG: hypothetical protein H6727_02490 [Myxococcales bacterium]|nr:hypothetical protein [Myxococcales bacterium]
MYKKSSPTKALFFLCFAAFAFTTLPNQAQATCYIQCTSTLSYNNCTAPASPTKWPANLAPTFQVECQTCCSPPGGPSQCSASSFNATDFLILDNNQPIQGNFSLLTRSCGSKSLIQYSQAISPGKNYALLSRVPGAGNMITLQFEITSSSQEPPVESVEEVLPDPEVIPDPEVSPDREVAPDPEGGNPDEPMSVEDPPRDEPPVDDKIRDEPPIDGPPIDRDDTITPDGCGGVVDASSPDDPSMPDGCGSNRPDTPPTDNKVTDAPASNPDSGTTDNTVKDSMGWGCQSSAPPPASMFFLLFGLVFFKRRQRA